MHTQVRSKAVAAFAICGMLAVLLICAGAARAQHAFTLEQVLSAPFPSDLIAAKSVPRIAWVLDEQGKRNIYVAEAPDFKARRLTSYSEEDGQELSALQFSADGNTIVYSCRRCSFQPMATPLFIPGEAVRITQGSRRIPPAILLARNNWSSRFPGRAAIHKKSMPATPDVFPAREFTLMRAMASCGWRRWMAKTSRYSWSCAERILPRPGLRTAVSWRLFRRAAITASSAFMK